MRQTRAEETVLNVKSKDWKGKRAAREKKERGPLETDREWIYISFGMGRGTNELPHRLPPPQPVAPSPCCVPPAPNRVM